MNWSGCWRKETSLRLSCLKSTLSVRLAHQMDSSHSRLATHIFIHNVWHVNVVLLICIDKQSWLWRWWKFWIDFSSGNGTIFWPRALADASLWSRIFLTRYIYIFIKTSLIMGSPTVYGNIKHVCGFSFQSWHFQSNFVSILISFQSWFRFNLDTSNLDTSKKAFFLLLQMSVK